MADFAVRFTVRNQSGQRAATWKCWSQAGKEDVYLACRELGGALKTSLHESGRWHTAYFEGFFEGSVPEEHRTERGRFIDQWQRPEPIAPGVTLAYRIVTPWSSVTAPDEESGSLVSVPAPPEGRAIEFDVFLRQRDPRLAGEELDEDRVGGVVLSSRWKHSLGCLVGDRDAHNTSPAGKAEILSRAEHGRS